MNTAERDVVLPIRLIISYAITSSGADKPFILFAHRRVGYKRGVADVSES